MNYYSDLNKQHIKKLIDWLIDEVCSSGGDGDAIWFSNFYDVKHLKKFIEEEIELGDWIISEIKNKSFSIGRDQEYILITNDKDKFVNRPDWQQVAIEY